MGDFWGKEFNKTRAIEYRHCLCLTCKLGQLRPWTETPFCLHCIELGVTKFKEDLESLSESQVFGYTAWRNDWVKKNTEFA